jgi:hypothetical protein
MYKHFPVAGAANFRRQSKIAHFDFKILGEEQIAEFQVTMNYMLLVKVLQGMADLVHEITSLGFRDGSSPVYHLGQRLGTI